MLSKIEFEAVRSSADYSTYVAAVRPAERRRMALEAAVCLVVMLIGLWWAHMMQAEVEGLLAAVEKDPVLRPLLDHPIARN